MKKVLFITGTRADYGKMKPLIKALDNNNNFETYIFVCGMHLISKFGNTSNELIKDKYKNLLIPKNLILTEDTCSNFTKTIDALTYYVNEIKPNIIVIHGDRFDALAGAIVGAIKNIFVCHIEGGELSGTIDESIRHAITKFAHIHFVCNDEAKRRLIQLGEEEKRIFVIGSPDIDIMLSDSLPSIKIAKKRYDIKFKDYGIFMYHPVTTEFSNLKKNIVNVIDGLILSKKKFIIIYPNNDLGSDIIIQEFEKVKNNKNFVIFPSLRFEYFLTLLKYSKVIIGNSSAGIREASVYGVPTIDIGTRQNGRYLLQDLKNIQHVSEESKDILNAINNIDKYRYKSLKFGMGNSTKMFLETLLNINLSNIGIQKHFIDIK